MTTEKCHCGRFGKWTLIAVILVLAVGVLSWATMDQRKSIAQTLRQLDDCKTFSQCVEKAGLSGVLEKDGPFTVFVPTNEAFESVPKGKLTDLLNNKSALTAVLLYHMVPKSLTSTEMANLGDCLTCTVPQSSISCDEHSFGKGKCLKSEIPCSNGFIYIVDAVQFPPFLTDPQVMETDEVTVVEEVGESTPANPNAEKPTETKPAEAKSMETKPTEAKPAADVSSVAKEKEENLPSQSADSNKESAAAPTEKTPDGP